MNTHLKPTLKLKLNTHYLLWFGASNTYNIIDENFNTLLELYFKHTSLSDFKNSITLDTKTFDTVVNQINLFLKQCNTPTKITPLEGTPEKVDTPLKHYITFKNTTLLLEFDTPLVREIILPPLKHLETKTKNELQKHYKFFRKEKHLYLTDGDDNVIIKVHQLDMHLLQGKFMFLFLCAIHNKTEADWAATFHGCAITNQKKSIFITGVSGKGKSTFSTLLASHGYYLLADDITPLLAEDYNFYYNPAAVSIKSGSFNTIKPHVPNFDAFVTTTFKKDKGPIKYIPFKVPKHLNYPNTAIVLINYKANAKTKLEPAELPEVLEAFIADSWISPKPEHAKSFMKWLETQQFYSLTYSNTNEAINCVKQLF